MEFDRFSGGLCHSGNEDRPIMFVKHCLPVPVFHYWPKLYRTPQHNLSAVAEHLGIFKLKFGL